MSISCNLIRENTRPYLRIEALSENRRNLTVKEGLSHAEMRGRESQRWSSGVVARWGGGLKVSVFSVRISVLKLLGSRSGFSVQVSGFIQSQETCI